MLKRQVFEHTGAQAMPAFIQRSLNFG